MKWIVRRLQSFSFTYFLVLPILSLLLQHPAVAQTQTGGLVYPIPGGTAANYYFAKQGDITIIVNVWGDVQRPGRYEIASNIDLVNLLSLAGGPGPDATLGEIRITRLTQQEDTLSHRKNLTVNLEDLTKLSLEELAVYPRDTIVVVRSTWSKVREVLSTALPFLSFALVIVQLVFILSR